MIGEVTETVPDVIEPYVGWRVWRVVETNEGPLLRSLNATEWVPGEVLVAKCTGRTDGPWHDITINVIPGSPVPVVSTRWGRKFNYCSKVPSDDQQNHTGAGCGIYASIDAAESVGQYFPRVGWKVDRIPADEPYVLGKVELFGRVVVAEKGFRAEKARIVSVCNTHPLIEQISERYVVPVEEIDADAELEIFRGRNPFAHSSSASAMSFFIPATVASSAWDQAWQSLGQMMRTPVTFTFDTLAQSAAREAADRAARDAEKELAKPFRRHYLNKYFGVDGANPLKNIGS